MSYCNECTNHDACATGCLEGAKLREHSDKHCERCAELKRELAEVTEGFRQVSDAFLAQAQQSSATQSSTALAPKHLQDAVRVKRETFRVVSPDNPMKMIDVVYAPTAACIEREANQLRAQLAAANLRADARAREACTAEKRTTCSFAPSATGAVQWLAELLKACPHAKLTWNDDADLEDEMGLVPVGYSLRIHSCHSMTVASDTLEGLLELAMRAEPDEDGNVESPSPNDIQREGKP